MGLPYGWVLYVASDKMIPIWVGVIAQVFFALFIALAYAVSASLYNLAAKLVGGMKIELEVDNDA